jgi:hypothetical protein
VTFFHSAAPGIGRESNRVTVDVDIGQNASGVLYALGGVAGGLALYMDKGHLVYEYNMMMIERYIGHSAEALAPGKHQIDIDTSVAKMAGFPDLSSLARLSRPLRPHLGRPHHDFVFARGRFATRGGRSVAARTHGHERLLSAPNTPRMLLPRELVP